MKVLISIASRCSPREWAEGISKYPEVVDLWNNHADKDLRDYETSGNLPHHQFFASRFDVTDLPSALSHYLTMLYELSWQFTVTARFDDGTVVRCHCVMDDMQASLTTAYGEKELPAGPTPFSRWVRYVASRTNMNLFAAKVRNISARTQEKAGTIGAGKIETSEDNSMFESFCFRLLCEFAHDEVLGTRPIKDVVDAGVRHAWNRSSMYQELKENLSV